MNNTVTPRQVEAMEREIDSIMSKAKTDIESDTMDFCQKIKKCWADENAVDLAKKVTNSMNGVINGMSINSNRVKSDIVDIHNMYARQAQKPCMNASRLNFHSALNPTIVKSTFEDGETYGFKNDSSAGSILNAMQDLVKKCDKVSFEVNSSLSSINAFGNPEISNKIVKAGTEVGDSVGKAIQKIVNDFRVSFEKASKDYENISSSFDSSMLGTIEDAFGDYGLAGGVGAAAAAAGHTAATIGENYDAYREKKEKEYNETVEQLKAEGYSDKFSEFAASLEDYSSKQKYEFINEVFK